MEDIVLLKTKNDGLWEKNPHLAYIGWALLGIFGFFAFGFLGVYLDKILSVLCYILSVAFLVFFGIILPMIKNNKYNISKSIGFIKRENYLYVIKLMYDPLVAGTFDRTSSIDNNISYAVNVQRMEHEIRNRRTNKEEYIFALNDILQKLASTPNSFRGTYFSKFDEIVDGFKTIDTKSGTYGFVALKDPKVINENKNYIKISYIEKENIRKEIKFRNAYGNLTEIIKDNL